MAINLNKPLRVKNCPVSCIYQYLGLRDNSGYLVLKNEEGYFSLYSEDQLENVDMTLNLKKPMWAKPSIVHPDLFWPFFYIGKTKTGKIVIEDARGDVGVFEQHDLENVRNLDE